MKLLLLFEKCFWSYFQLTLCQNYSTLGGHVHSLCEVKSSNVSS